MFHLKNLALMLLGLVFSFNGVSQEPKKNHLFVELGGQGLLYSLNYERVLFKKIALRGGISYWGVRIGDNQGDTYFCIPLVVNNTFGSNEHRLETGGGIIYQIATFGGTRRKSGVSATGTVGYRFVTNSGLLFRIVFTPMYLSWEKRFLPMGGLSFGAEF